VKSSREPFVFFLSLACGAGAAFGAEGSNRTERMLALRSPNEAVAVTIALVSLEGRPGVPVYSVSYQGRELLHQSRLGLELERTGPLVANLDMVKTVLRSSDTIATLGFGKSSQARDHYREAEVALEENVPPHRHLSVVFRAYDDGIAFRYLIPPQPALSEVAIREELTTFAFTAAPRAHYLPLVFGSPYEYFYSHSDIREINPDLNIALPLLLECQPDIYVAVTEACLTDYAGLYLGATTGTGTLKSRLAPSLGGTDVKVRGTVPFSSPWRVVLFGATPGALLDSNIVRLLNPPANIGDTSWIRPGKVVFGWWNGYDMPDAPPFVAGVNTPTIKRFIDFASENGIPFVSLDGTNEEAWYGGPVGEYAGQDVTKANPNLDLPEVLAYAQAKGVKIRLWLHWRGLEKYMEQALPLYEKWGVSGLMVDFINGDSQEMVRFVTKVAQATAQHHLTVNFHGVYKPTGIERTYPNLLSYEGVLGTEYNKWDTMGSTPEHEMDTLFVRMIAGPLDIHEGSVHPVVPERYAPANRPSTQGTIMRQMAAYVVYDNPLPMLADCVSAYRGQPRLLPFLRDVPTVWDESRVLTASLDRYLMIAKRQGAAWYVGCINARAAQELDVSLNFLPPGDYAAAICSDGRDADVEPGSYEIRQFRVSASDIVHARLARAGGFVMSLKPVPPGVSLPRYH
jgi:alpha-glucosidase